MMFSITASVLDALAVALPHSEFEQEAERSIVATAAAERMNDFFIFSFGVENFESVNFFLEVAVVRAGRCGQSPGAFRRGTR